MVVSVEEIETTWSQADCLFTQAQVDKSIDVVAANITRDLGKENPVILAVMNGGLWFTAELLRRLSFPLQQDYIHATRYDNTTVGGELSWMRSVPDWVRGRTVVIVDDILDQGNTLDMICRACADKGVAKVVSAVLVSKEVERKPPSVLHADYTALSVPDRYVFGYGMDYKGYLRNASGIYAVRGL